MTVHQFIDLIFLTLFNGVVWGSVLTDWKHRR